MLTLLCWLRYLRRPAISRYAAALVSFALGLMAKSMLVTLPLLLLLLDYWPLGRCCRGGKGIGLALLREKTPFFVLAAVSSGLTLLAQAGAMAPLSGTHAIAARLSNALVSYVAYLGKFLYPVGLVVFYPHQGPALPFWKSALAAVLLAGVTALVFSARRRAPHLMVGWVWYLGMLIPVIGIVQVGSQAMADRYTYLPSVGIFMAIAWTFGLAARTPRLRPVVMTIGVAVVLALVPITARQVTYWHDEESLFGHALTIIPENPVAHDGLGSALTGAGRYDEALRHHQEAIRISPSATPYFNLGVHYTRRRLWPEAIGAFRTSISLQPEFVEAHANLGAALASIGSLDEAIEEMQVAVRLKPDEALAHFNLGLFLEARGRLAEAREHFGEALRLDPRDAEARARLEKIRGATPRRREP